MREPGGESGLAALERRYFMDKSTLYIRMCEKAVEIQEQFAHADGSLLAGKVYRTVFIWPFEIAFHSSGLVTEDYIWLPRQDQLQDIVRGGDNSTSIKEKITSFYQYCISERPIEPDKFGRMYWYYTSMEQLWLAFVMDRKYSKYWDGSDWIVKGS